MCGRGQAVLNMLVVAPLVHTLSGLINSTSNSNGSSSTSAGGSSSNVCLVGEADGGSAQPTTTVISVSKFAAGGMWAGKALEVSRWGGV